MKKIIIGVSLFSALSAFATTSTYREDSTLISLSQISTTATNNTDSISLGPYQSGSIQCVWAAVSGTQPVYKLQFSNNNSNWDDVSGASTTTSGASGSGTWIVDPIISLSARILVSTTSTTGTLNCTAVLKRG